MARPVPAAGRPVTARVVPAVAAGVGHVAWRPSWRCRACRRPWPCEPARAELLASFDRIGRCMYVAELAAEAARDLPDLTPAQTYARFIAWARRREPA
ncbi:flavin reductase [Micromonospora sp. LOL_015]|uniref:flavin reductase n=1 Tax=Micromonospora sp. LOL_015 TaxID=3345416 RepID=UPI003A855F52